MSILTVVSNYIILAVVDTFNRTYAIFETTKQNKKYLLYTAKVLSIQNVWMFVFAFLTNLQMNRPSFIQFSLSFLRT